MCKGLLPGRIILTPSQGSNPFEEYNPQNSISVLIHAVPSYKQYIDFSSLRVSIENERHRAFATKLLKTR